MHSTHADTISTNYSRRYSSSHHASSIATRRENVQPPEVAETMKNQMHSALLGLLKTLNTPKTGSH